MTLEELWQGKSNWEVELATRQILEYTEEAQQVIRSEVEKRGISGSPAFTGSVVQRDPNRLGNLLEKSRLDGLDSTTSDSSFRRIIRIVGKLTALVFLSLFVALLVATSRFILPFLIIVGLLYGIYRAIAYRNCYLLLYEQGVVYEQPNEKRVAYYDELEIWQAITQVYYNSVPMGEESERYTLRFPDGERVTTFKESIGRKLQMMVVQHQLPQALEIYNRGNNVLFNSAICLNKVGMSINKVSLTWSEAVSIKWSDISHVDVTEGTIYIYQVGRRDAISGISVSEVPNVYVLLNLLSQLGYYNAEGTAEDFRTP